MGILKDVDINKIFTALTAGIGKSITDAECDECGCSMSTPPVERIGEPRICGSCVLQIQYERRIVFDDYMSQERPRGRTIHKVKLPPGGLK